MNQMTNLSALEPEIIEIPAGPFLMGAPNDDEWALEDEKPQHTITLAAYRIGRYPITNREYGAYVQHSPDVNHLFPEGKDDHPIVNVTWQDSNAYCRWLSEATGKRYLLPTEAQWEKAARGEHGLRFPWGADKDVSICNTIDGGFGGTTPVGHFSPRADSPYGCADMAGNVWEWVSTRWWRDELKVVFEYPYDPADGREDQDAITNAVRITRGGSWSYRFSSAYAARRYHSHPNFSSNRNGFRVALILD